MSFSSPLHRGAQHAAQRGRSGRALVAFSVMGSLLLSGAFGVFPLAQTQAAGSEEAPLASVDAPESGVELNEQGFEPIPLEEMSDDPDAPAAQESEAASPEASATPTESAEAAAAESDEDAESEEAADQPQSAESAAEPQMSEFLRAARAPRRAPGSPLDAVFATGGSGRFKESIQWLQWADISEFQTTPGANQGLPLGADVRPGHQQVQRFVKILESESDQKTLVNRRNLGDAGLLETTCTLSGLKKSGYDRFKAKDGALVATIPGTWAGDALDNMYNVGGEGKATKLNADDTYTFPDNYSNPNRMVIGLGNGYAKYGNDGEGHALRMDFNLKCEAALVHPDGSKDTVDVEGLVFADAEASSTKQSDEAPEEWVQAVPNAGQSATWRVLDTYKYDTEKLECPTTTQALFTEGGVRLTPIGGNGQECVYQNGGGWPNVKGKGGPDAVMFMEGVTDARFSVLGRGYSAIALGMVIASDFGDAPKTYGHAGALFQPKWKDGKVSGTSDAFTVQPQASMLVDEGSPSLGVKIDAEGYQQFSDGADGDDTHGLEDDEDALSSVPDIPSGFLNGDKDSFKLKGVACSPGKGTVRGWIDWNGNGTFDPDKKEQSDDQNCPASGSVDLTFPKPDEAPLDTNLVNKDSTYLRLRTFGTGDTSKATGPVGVTTKGEVEDYKIPLPPLLQLTKKVSNEYSGTALPQDWDLTAKIGGTTLTYASGALKYVDAGTYALDESPKTELAKNGYEWKSLACKTGPAGADPGTDAGASFSNKRVEVKNGTRTECDFNNADKPGSISWNKVNEKGEFLAGSEWTLKGNPQPTGGVKVVDCTQAACQPGMYLDQDPAPGKFRIEKLHWGDYTVTEKTAPDGYMLLGSEFAFEKIDDKHSDVKLKQVEGAIKDNGIINKPLPNVTWEKRADKEDGDLLPGSVWSWVPIDEHGHEGTAVEITDCVKDDASACAGPDKDPAEGKFKLEKVTPGKYRLTEKTAPDGYDPDPTPRDVEVNDQSLSTIELGVIVNKKSQGIVKWLKVDADNDKSLAGSEWSITSKKDGSAIEVKDCTTAGCTGVPGDTNADPGAFEVELPYGDYVLKETKAPVGYQVTAIETPFTVDAGNKTVDLGPIKNEKSSVPPLPLTGGMSADSFLILGGGGLLLAAATAFAQRRRAMVRSEVRSLRSN